MDLFKDPANREADLREALRRLRAIRAEQRKAKRNPPPSLEREPEPAKTCSFCNEAKLPLVGGLGLFICRECAAMAVELIDHRNAETESAHGLL